MAGWNRRIVVHFLLPLSKLGASTAIVSLAFLSNHVPSRSNPRKSTSSDETEPLPNKSPESNFWSAIPASTPFSKTSSSSLPAIPHLDQETGPLPPGAYRTIEDNQGREPLTSCLLAIGVRPPAADGRDVWTEGAKHAQKFIDAGFDAFRVEDACREPSNGNDAGKRGSKSAEDRWRRRRVSRTLERQRSETILYKKLRETTPSSVLRSCCFMVHMEIPSILSEGDPRGKEKRSSSIPYGNGWMVRESVSDALLRVRGECLDSVVLDCE